MRTLTTLFTLAALLLCTTAYPQKQHRSAGNGEKTVKASKNYVTKEFRVSSFTGLNLAGGAPTVIYTQKSGKPKVEVYAPDNIIDRMDISVARNTLNVKVKKGFRISHESLEIRVSSPTLNHISVSGAGEVILRNGLKTDNLKLSVSGAGDIDAKNLVCSGDLTVSITGAGDIESDKVTCSKLKASVTGAGDLDLKNISAGTADVSIAGTGDVELSGSAREAAYRVSGSGDLDAANLRTKRTDANVSGTGNIQCHATDYLKAYASGTGSIEYKGSPKVDQSKKGVRKL